MYMGTWRLSDTFEPIEISQSPQIGGTTDGVETDLARYDTRYGTVTSVRH